MKDFICLPLLQASPIGCVYFSNIPRKYKHLTFFINFQCLSILNPFIVNVDIMLKKIDLEFCRTLVPSHIAVVSQRQVVERKKICQMTFVWIVTVLVNAPVLYTGIAGEREICCVFFKSFNKK